MSKEGFVSSDLLSMAVAKSGGFSRPHQYVAIITPPAILMQRYAQYDLERIATNCASTALMGRGFASVDQDQGGQIGRKIAHTPIFQDLQTMFYLSNDLLEKRIMDEWQDLVYDPATGNTKYYEEYVGTVTLIKHSKSMGAGALYKYHYLEAYPITVGEVALDYSMTNAINTMRVDFAYWQWTREGTSAQDQALLAQKAQELPNYTPDSVAKMNDPAYPKNQKEWDNYYGTNTNKSGKNPVYDTMGNFTGYTTDS